MPVTKETLGTNTTITMNLTSLGTSSTLIVGWQSAAVDNTTNLYIDALVQGNFTVGTTPATTGGLAIYVWGAQTNPTTTAIDSITGLDATCTFTTTSLANTVIFARKQSVLVNTSNTKYQVQPFSVAALFGGTMPKYWGLYVAQDTGVALKTDAANTDSFSYYGLTYTTA